METTKLGKDLDSIVLSVKLPTNTEIAKILGTSQGNISLMNRRPRSAKKLFLLKLGLLKLKELQEGKE